MNRELWEHQSYDNDLAAEHIPFLKRMASGPITFVVLVLTAFTAVVWFLWWWPQ